MANKNNKAVKNTALTRIIVINKEEYHYSFTKNYFLLTKISSKEKFAFQYKNIIKNKLFNLGMFEFISIFILIVGSLKIYFIITILLGIYLYLRWELSKILWVASKIGEDHSSFYFKFNTQEEKIIFNKELNIYIKENKGE